MFFRKSRSSKLRFSGNLNWNKDGLPLLPVHASIDISLLDIYIYIYIYIFVFFLFFCLSAPARRRRRRRRCFTGSCLPALAALPLLQASLPALAALPLLQASLPLSVMSLQVIFRTPLVRALCVGWERLASQPTPSTDKTAARTFGLAERKTQLQHTRAHWCCDGLPTALIRAHWCCDGLPTALMADRGAS